MLGGYLEFFMKPNLAVTYLSLKKEFDEIIQKKVSGNWTCFESRNHLHTLQ